MNNLSLPQKVAEHLTKRPVTILYGPMREYGLLGTCSKDSTGRIVINLDQDLSNDQMFRTLLHEVAHAKLHYSRLPLMSHADTLTAIKSGGSQVSSSRLSSALYAQKEQEANDFEQTLYNYANKKAYDFAGRCKAILSLVEVSEGRFEPRGA